MNKLYVFSGASGVGKSTVLKELMARREDILFSVSATTRKPRPDEVDGKNYYFIDRERCEQMIREDAFLEYDDHMGNLYGTPKFQLLEKMEKADVALDIEPNGALNVKRWRSDAVLIFIAPPSLEELERRLRGRGDTPEDQIKLRMERVHWEMEQIPKYDYTVINDEVSACVDEILKIMNK